MTSRANRRRRRARTRRRDDVHMQALLRRARAQIRDLGRGGSVFDLADELECPDARCALLGALDALVNEELLGPLRAPGSPRDDELS